MEFCALGRLPLDWIFGILVGEILVIVQVESGAAAGGVTFEDDSVWVNVPLFCLALEELHCSCRVHYRRWQWRTVVRSVVVRWNTVGVAHPAVFNHCNERQQQLSSSVVADCERADAGTIQFAKDT